jgi:signal transduction histidine kinase
MPPLRPVELVLLRSRRLPWVVTAAMLAVLAGTIMLASWQVRRNTRAQIAARDAELLYGVALMLQHEQAAELEWVFDPDDPLQHSFVLLKASQLGRVLAARLFDREGRFIEAFPPDVRPAHLPAAALRQLRSFTPTSRYHAAARLSELFESSNAAHGEPEQPVPILEVNVPLPSLRQGGLSGVAQFILEGRSIAAQYARLDWLIVGQAAAAFGVGGGILAAVVWWAFRRLRQTNELLAQRTRDLQAANQELAWAAKTSALGAITAHLIHGLKSPLSGLQSFVTSVSPPEPEHEAEAWRQAIASTRRMQALINQVVNVLHELQGPDRYELTLAELAAVVVQQVEPLAQARQVQLVPRLEGEATVSNRVANLLSLILVNLCQNGIEASPAGGQVTLHLANAGEQIRCEVVDQGPGFPEALRPHLFKPCVSTKEGGSGLGLAICKQLANHLGATLELEPSSATGCRFVLALPLARCKAPPPPSSTLTVSA